MIKFTDGENEYFWTNDDKIIGMNEKNANTLKMAISVELTLPQNQFVSLLTIIESMGYTILEQNIEYAEKDEIELEIAY